VKDQSYEEPGWKLPGDAGLGCVGYRVRRLSRVVSAIYDDAFSPLKLKISQFGILAMLSRYGPSTAVDLCRLVMMDKSTASRNLQRMRRRGWISVVHEGTGLGQQISLTREGARILRTAYPLWRRAQDKTTRRLGADGLKALETVMVRMKE
jgi:DNA-binding MarR family transcriptional regulator